MHPPSLPEPLHCDQYFFINELIALIFADDVSSFSDTIMRLQRQINSIEQLCKSFDMIIILDICIWLCLCFFFYMPDFKSCWLVSFI